MRWRQGINIQGLMLYNVGGRRKVLGTLIVSYDMVYPLRVRFAVHKAELQFFVPDQDGHGLYGNGVDGGGEVFQKGIFHHVEGFDGFAPGARHVASQTMFVGIVDDLLPLQFGKPGTTRPPISNQFAFANRLLSSPVMVKSSSSFSYRYLTASRNMSHEAPV